MECGNKNPGILESHNSGILEFWNPKSRIRNPESGFLNLKKKRQEEEEN